MREGSLEAPTRHPINWKDPDFYDEAALDSELRRVFDICHGCRRCFNLCDSFPRLFDLIDESESGELDTVNSSDFKPIIDACTLCDMCFMTKCPYVPPHEFNLDFPHLMLRYRAIEFEKGNVAKINQQLTETDRNGKLGSFASPLINWASQRNNNFTRPIMEKTVGIHRDAELPKFAAQTFLKQAIKNQKQKPENTTVSKRKVALYATCFANYNDPEIGKAAQAILTHNNIETKVIYPECCGMPQLEHGDISRVSDKSDKIAASLKPYIEDGYDIVALVPSCALMLKFEWPLINPDNPDIQKLANATFDISEYIIDIHKKEGLVDGIKALDGPISLHIACHARAQNMGQKATEMMKLIPDTPLKVVERCSGHGGAWGVRKENFDTAIKVGRPVYRQMKNNGQAHYVVSECPLAGAHIAQGMEDKNADKEGKTKPVIAPHPIILLAHAYGLEV